MEPITTATALKLLGIQLGGSILGSLFGKRPDRSKSVPDSLFDVIPLLEQVTSNAISRNETNRGDALNDAFDNFRAAGLTGSALGNAAANAQVPLAQQTVSLLANLAQVRAREQARAQLARAQNAQANFTDDLAFSQNRSQGIADFLGAGATILGQGFMSGDPMVQRNRAREDILFSLGFPSTTTVPFSLSDAFMDIEPSTTARVGF